jgi:glycosyltransferase involved in cell wall biosynthesis
VRIAIQAADLDHERIDGTRVYILNLLKYFGELDKETEFLIYHRRKFNPELTPPNFPNYTIKPVSAPAFWTQTRFAYEIWKDKVDVLWMPMHNLPAMHSRKVKTFVTIHDLAFKFFPESFTRTDLAKLNFLTDRAVQNTDKLIAISQATKDDILKIYPEVSPDNVRVIFHGFDPEVYEQPRDLVREKEVKEQVGIPGDYLLYIGAIQPRKNLEVFVEAFNMVKKKQKSNLNLVLAGEKAWLSEKTIKAAENSPFSRDIIMPGRVKFCDLGHLCRGARIFVFPSLYEGFGIPPLEAMAAKVPVILANNSSLPEVGGDAAMYFDAQKPEDLADKIERVLGDETLRAEMIARGLEQAKNFSWRRCAEETLDYLKS